MNTIERLRELQAKEERAKNSSDWQKHLTAIGDTSSAAYDAIPALLAVVEAQAAEIEAWRGLADARFKGRTMYEGDQFQTIRDARTNTDAALRALEGGE